jgi:glycosyltransferase involved in cell wall biosynthesis
VIAFPAGGIPEVVMDGETGFLTRHLTAESLAERIREVMTADRDKIRQIARNARRAWGELYTVSAYQQRITNLLEMLVPVSREEREAEMPLKRK